MTHDLTPQVDKPIWPLSSYGAAKHEPTLISGLDESPEELRFRAVIALQAGNINEYVSTHGLVHHVSASLTDIASRNKAHVRVGQNDGR